MADANKTEKATPRREKKAREEGQVPRSRELGSALTILAVTATLWWGAERWPREWSRLLADLLSSASGESADRYLGLIRSSALLAFSWTAPAGLAGCATAIFASVIQGGLIFAPAALTPKPSRLNPAENVKNLVSLRSVRNVLKSVVPTFVLGYLVVGEMARHWPEFQYLELMPAAASIRWLLGLVFEALWKGALVFTIWSSLDYLLERFSFGRQLRMSRAEIKDEGKENEGNPATKVRIRRLQRRMRKLRMSGSVAQATVVVTNPTEFAVALRYVPGEMPAPVVVAKGRGLLAQTIRRDAIWHGVPVVESPLLARALYRSVEIDQSIPAQLYLAVAEILAFIYRTQRSAPGERPHTPGNERRPA